MGTGLEQALHFETESEQEYQLVPYLQIVIDKRNVVHQDITTSSGLRKQAVAATQTVPPQLWSSFKVMNKIQCSLRFQVE